MGKTCKETCSKSGRVCNSDVQSHLTTNELVREKMALAGHICQGFHDSRDYPGAPFATERDDNDCAPMKSGKRSICYGVQFPNIRPLCYCEGTHMLQTYKENELIQKQIFTISL